MSTIEAVLKKDRAIVFAGLLGVTALAWAYLILMARAMHSMPDTMGDAMAMTQIKSWSAMDFVLMFLMWAIMMVGMMVPSAAPMVLIFASYNRKQNEDNRPFVPTGAFLTGYLVVWTFFSLMATILQWALDQAALLSPMMVSRSPMLGGILLIAAGTFQMTPMKDTCLKHCRSPLEFFMSGWRNGTAGALRMGLEHGFYCLGCCWFLMGLLFFGGVMNLLWIAAITMFVLLEKAAPFGTKVAKLSGPVLALLGIFVITQT